MPMRLPPTSHTHFAMVPLLCAAALLGGCVATGTASTLAPSEATPSLVTVSDPAVAAAPVKTAVEPATPKVKGASGFGSSPKATTKAAAQPASLMPQIGPKVQARDANAAYQLSADELKLECKKLTGKMQVRLLQVRDQRERTLTSKAAQTIQATVVPVLGGSPVGANPGDDFKRDKAMLEAYNSRLAEKNCPTYNLETELQSRSVRDTPQPVPKADTPKPSKPKS